jgi:hypothetical protein
MSVMLSKMQAEIVSEDRTMKPNLEAMLQGKSSSSLSPWHLDFLHGFERYCLQAPASVGTRTLWSTL